MKRLFAIALLFAGLAARAQETPTVTARVEPDSIMIGDRFDYVIDVEKDLVQVVEFPVFDPRDGKIELVENCPVDTLERDGRRLKLRKRYRLAAFDEGKYNLGAAQVLYADKNILDTLRSTDSVYLEVATFQIDSTSQSIYDLKAQKNLPFRFREVSGYVKWGVFFLLLLLAAGAIMIVTLWTSRRALSVSKTELSLSNQNEGEERYGSSVVSRGLVRAAMNVNAFYERIMPARLQRAVAARFEKLPEEEREGGSYDLIRATVNLTTASILISIATSLKLPLSTTYVCFMVSMGSSLADRAWGRESAVYRITGVLTVVSGWFVTGFGAFTIAFLVGLTLMYGGNAAVLIVSALCGWMLVRSNRRKNRAAVAETQRPAASRAKDTEGVIEECIAEVCYTMGQVTRIYDRTLIAVFKENRKVLREMVQQSNDLFYRSRERKYKVMPLLLRLQDNEIDSGHYYVQVVDYMNEITKSLLHVTRPCFDHIDNNHEGMTREQIEDLMKINDEVETIFTRINVMLRNNDFADIDLILELRDELFESIADAIKRQLKRIKNKQSSTKASLLYLTILNETKTMVLQARNLVKSQRYFLEHKTE